MNGSTQIISFFDGHYQLIRILFVIVGTSAIVCGTSIVTAIMVTPKLRKNNSYVLLAMQSFVDALAG